MKIDLPRESSSEENPTPGNGLKSLIDLVFILIGPSILPFSLLFADWKIGGAIESLALLAALLGMGALGAAISSVILRCSPLPGSTVRIHAARFGARGGTLVVLLGGGIFVFISTLSYTKWISDTPLSLHPFSLWLLLSLCLVPVVSFTSFMTVVFSRMLNPTEFRRETVVVHPTNESQPRSSKPFLIATIVAIVFLSTPGLLLILPIANLEEEPVGSDSRATQPVVSQEAEDSDLPLEPAFAYSQPIEFDTAASYRWKLLTRKEIVDIDTSRPVAMSPNGRYFSYSQNGTSDNLAILDLDRFEIVSVFPEMSRLEQLAWSPESDLLYCLTEQERPFSYLVNIEKRTVDALPLLPEASFPNIQPFWWNQFEIAFFPKSDTKLFLDLAQLRVRPIEESHRWRKLKEDSASGIVEVPRLELAESARCHLTLAPRIYAYRVPGFQQERWSVNFDLTLSLEDKRVEHVKTVLAEGFDNEDRIVSTARSMKVIRLHRGRAEVLYFSLEETPLPFVECVLPDHFDVQSREEFAKALEAGEACAFICAPRINPLTKKPVGPDREKVRALVRWLEVEGGIAKFWIAELYDEIQQGDVVADIHRWKNGNIETLSSSLRDRWFAEVAFPEEEHVDESTVFDLPQLDRKFEVDFDSAKGWQRLREFTYPVAGTSSTLSDEPMREESAVSSMIPESDLSDSEEESIPEPTPNEQPQTVVEKIRAFVRNHYRAFQAKDLETYLGNYNQYLVYQGGAAERDQTLRPIVANAMSAETIEVEFPKQIEVSPLGGEDGGQYIVSFRVVILLTDRSGSTKTRGGDVKLKVFPLLDSFRIVEESSTPHTSR